MNKMPLDRLMELPADRPAAVQFVFEHMDTATYDLLESAIDPKGNHIQGLLKHEVFPFPVGKLCLTTFKTPSDAATFIDTRLHPALKQISFEAAAVHIEVYGTPEVAVYPEAFHYHS